jgi:hypothetical protein
MYTVYTYKSQPYIYAYSRRREAVSLPLVFVQALIIHLARSRANDCSMPPSLANPSSRLAAGKRNSGCNDCLT